MFKFEFDPRKAATNFRKHGVALKKLFQSLKAIQAPTRTMILSILLTTSVISQSALRPLETCYTSAIMKSMGLSASSARGAQPPANGNSMKTATTKSRSPKTAAKSGTAVRGKYFNQLPAGTNLAIIDPELHAHFPDSESVNRALRAFLGIREHLKAALPAASAKRQARAA